MTDVSGTGFNYLHPASVFRKKIIYPRDLHVYNRVIMTTAVINTHSAYYPLLVYYIGTMVTYSHAITRTSSITHSWCTSRRLDHAIIQTPSCDTKQCFLLDFQSDITCVFCFSFLSSCTPHP